MKDEQSEKLLTGMADALFLGRDLSREDIRRGIHKCYELGVVDGQIEELDKVNRGLKKQIRELK